MSRVSEDAVLNWFIGLLRDRFGAANVGDHMAPEGADVSVRPYAVVYLVTPVRQLMELAGTEDDLVTVVQVTVVGWTRRAAQRMASDVGATITDRLPSGAYAAAGPATPGFRVHDRISDESTGGIDVVGKAPDEVYSIPRLYRLSATPA